jgi:hypothetical protein
VKKAFSLSMILMSSLFVTQAMAAGNQRDCIIDAVERVNSGVFFSGSQEDRRSQVDDYLVNSDKFNGIQLVLNATQSCLTDETRQCAYDRVERTNSGVYFSGSDLKQVDNYLLNAGKYNGIQLVLTSVKECLK